MSFEDTLEYKLGKVLLAFFVGMAFLFLLVAQAMGVF